MTDNSAVNVTCSGETVTVKGSGALDLSNAEEFRHCLLSASDTADALVIDLSESTFIDTAVLSYMAKAAKTLLERGRRLKVLVSDKSHPLRVLKTVGFGEIMDIEVSPTAA